MNIFLRPTIFKVIITLLIFLVVFGGGVLYSHSFTITANGFSPPTNLFVITLYNIGNIIYYPVHVIISFISIKMTLSAYQNNPFPLYFVSGISFLLVILESYLISCIISILINKK